MDKIFVLYQIITLFLWKASDTMAVPGEQGQALA